ncbi:MAG: DUF2335 domain-containing protein [Planctomycetota bacterium]|nr:DUF2335 domain-containing protein [Planctomycetota bacterium]
MEEVQSMSITREVTHVGPIPSPAALAEYEKALPGLADRVVKMAEDESLHRRELEKQIVQAQVEDGRAARNDQKLGQKSGLSIAILVVLCGFGAICLGHPGVRDRLGWGLVSITCWSFCLRARANDRGVKRIK